MRTHNWAAWVAVIAAATVTGCARTSRFDGRRGAKAVTPSGRASRYGFRHDPMKFVANDRSLQGALVRSFVFDRAKPGDEQILQSEIDRILAMQNEDGSFPSEHEGEPTPQATAGKVLRLLELGCPADRPELHRAVAYAVEHGRDKDGTVGIYKLRAMYLTGAGDPKLRDASMRKLAARADEYIGWNKSCPWTPAVHLMTLWHGRGAEDVDATLVRGLSWIADNLNAAGCWDYNDPWGYVDCAGYVDHPIGRRIIEKEIPLILRGQAADGGWGRRSFKVFRALVKYGLLEPLRSLPPLPPDWQVVRSIPAPAAGLSTMTWDGKSLWVFDPGANTAIALSPKDGAVLKRVELPVKSVFGIGWWDDALAVAQTKPKRALKVSTQTGEIEKAIPLKKWDPWVQGIEQVNGNLWVADGFNGVAHVVDPADPQNERTLTLAGGGPTSFAAQPDGVWHFDYWAPAMIKSDFEGRLLDWGEKPFGGAVHGIAWDGKQLWALDSTRKRICVVEKNPARDRPVPAHKAPPGAWAGLIDSLAFGEVEAAAGGQQVLLENSVTNPLSVPLRVRSTWLTEGSAWKVEPLASDVSIAPGETATLRAVATFDENHMAPVPVRHAAILLDGREVTEVSHSFEPPAIRRTGVVARVKTPPVADGVIGNGEYGVAKPNTGFVDYRGHGRPDHDTSFLLACDDRALYVCIIAEEPEPDGVAGEPRERDGDIWKDDDVEVFIDATFDHKTYHQFAVSLKHGVQLDAIGGPTHGKFGDVKWNAEWQSAVKIGKDVVVVEFAVPYTVLGVAPPKPGARWGLNVCRQRLAAGKTQSETEMSAWSIPYANFHVPTHFGIVTFE